MFSFMYRLKLKELLKEINVNLISESDEEDEKGPDIYKKPSKPEEKEPRSKLLKGSDDDVS